MVFSGIFMPWPDHLLLSFIWENKFGSAVVWWYARCNFEFLYCAGFDRFWQTGCSVQLKVSNTANQIQLKANKVQSTAYELSNRFGSQRKAKFQKCHWTLLNEALFIHFHHFIVAINSFTGNVLFSGYEFSRSRERNQMNQDDLCGNNSKWKWTYHSLDQSFSLVQNEVGADWVERLRLETPRKQETPLGWSAR